MVLNQHFSGTTIKFGQASPSVNQEEKGSTEISHSGLMSVRKRSRQLFKMSFMRNCTLFVESAVTNMLTVDDSGVLVRAVLLEDRLLSSNIRNHKVINAGHLVSYKRTKAVP